MVYCNPVDCKMFQIGEMARNVETEKTSRDDTS